MLKKPTISTVSVCIHNTLSYCMRRFHRTWTTCRRKTKDLDGKRGCASQIGKVNKNTLMIENLLLLTYTIILCLYCVEGYLRLPQFLNTRSLNQNGYARKTNSLCFNSQLQDELLSNKLDDTEEQFRIKESNKIGTSIENTSLELSHSTIHSFSNQYFKLLFPIMLFIGTLCTVPLVSLSSGNDMTSSSSIQKSIAYQSDLIVPDYSMKLSSMSSPGASQVGDIISEYLNRVRSGVTGVKVNELRVGDSLVRRLRAVEQELNEIQKDIFEDNVDWDVISVYPKIFRTYAPLFTAYTDRAFPTQSPVDISLRYALRYEVGGFYNGVKDFEEAVVKKSQRQLQRAFAKISLSYDRYYKAGDLYLQYDTNQVALGLKSIQSEKSSILTTNLIPLSRSASKQATEVNNYFDQESSFIQKLNYIAPSIEAPSLQDEVVLLKGPDKGRKGVVLWIAKGANIESSNVVIKFETATGTDYSHNEVKLYPYNFVAKTTPPEVQFFDDLLAAYFASAISCGIMYPIDTYKTRLQVGKKGVPSSEEGGIFGLYKGVQYFVADANDAVYVASYGFIKPLFLSPVDPSNPFLVFTALVLSGSAGDALGSVFRVPMEIVWKRVQAGLTNSGIKVLLSFGSKDLPIRTLLICWAAVLLRDMPFAGLQIALYDIYKNLFAFLDELGWTMFAQSALWGVLAGGTAAYLTTPFDVLTTNILTAIEEETEPLPEPTHDMNTEMSSIVDNSTLPSVQIVTKKTQLKNESPGVMITDVKSMDSLKRAVEISTKNSIYFVQDTIDLFKKSFRDVIDKEPNLEGKIGALFNGGFERILFFGPAAMIFFTTYESAFNIISVARERHGLWF